MLTSVELVINLVLLSFISSPAFLLSFAKVFIICSSFCGSSLSKMISSANLKWSSLRLFMFSPRSFQFSFRKMCSSTALNSLGDSGSPCLTPLSMENDSPIDSNFMRLLLLLQIELINFMLVFSTPCSFKLNRMYSCFILKPLNNQ